METRQIDNRLLKSLAIEVISAYGWASDSIYFDIAMGKKEKMSKEIEKHLIRLVWKARKANALSRGHYYRYMETHIKLQNREMN